MMSTPKRAPLHAPVDEEFGNETINDYQTDLCFTSQVSAVVAKNKAREDFQPNSSGANSDEPDEFKYNRRANNFISERNKKVARHLRSSYALEHDVSLNLDCTKNCIAHQDILELTPPTSVSLIF